MLTTSEVSYSWARQHLAELMDKILDENSVTFLQARFHYWYQIFVSYRSDNFDSLLHAAKIINYNNQSKI